MTQISVSGLVATTPRYLKTEEGLDIMSFRLASSGSTYDKNRKVWKHNETNWYTILLYKQTAVNAYASIHKGDRVLLAGVLKVRDWDNGERSGTSIEIEAETIGHDLSWGESTFKRTVLVKEQDEPEDGLAVQLAKVERELSDLRQTLAELSEPTEEN